MSLRRVQKARVWVWQVLLWVVVVTQTIRNTALQSKGFFTKVCFGFALHLPKGQKLERNEERGGKRRERKTRLLASSTEPVCWGFSLGQLSKLQVWIVHELKRPCEASRAFQVRGTMKGWTKRLVCLKSITYGNRQCLTLFISISVVHSLVIKYYLTSRKKKRKASSKRSSLLWWTPALERKMSSFQTCLFACLPRLIRIYRILESRTGAWCEGCRDLQKMLLGLW